MKRSLTSLNPCFSLKWILFLVLVLVAAGNANAQRPRGGAESPLKATYRKIEYMIPMRDGVKLYTAVYVPLKVEGKHPILMERTPYSAGPYGADAYKGRFRGSQKLQDAGYIFAFQDVRGKEHSEGEFVNVRPQLKEGERGIDESTDTYDTIDYLVKNVPDNNGKVGLWGISYPGFYTAAGAINSHPALAAISPQAPVSDWFIGDDVHHNGAFFVQDNFDFSLFFDVPRPKDMTQEPDRPAEIDRGKGGAYGFFLRTGALPNLDKRYLKGKIPYWNEILDHDTYDDYWKARSLPGKLRNIHCAVLTVGGLFDAEDMWGALNTYQYVERQNPGIYNALVMGPWYHGMWASRQGQKFGDFDWGQNTSVYYQDNIEFPFFEKFLRDQMVSAPAEATIFDTGAHKWRTFEQWPEKNLKPLALYIDAKGVLAQNQPKNDGAEQYISDPANPTPYEAKPTDQRTTRYMLDDQRFAEARSDVLTYKTAPLSADTTTSGPITVDLYASTSGTDADFVVKVIDVYPETPTPKAAAAPVKNVGFVGRWQGVISVQSREITILFDIKKDAQNQYSTTLFVPQQTQEGLPTTKTTAATSGALLIEMPEIGGSFDGTLDPSGNQIIGQWKQGDVSLPLTLKPAAPVPAVNFSGYEMLVRADVMRGKFRDSLENPKPFVPGEPTRVSFTLNDVLHTFRKGHRIMLQVQSSWFPLVDRNPNKFVNINHAKDEDFQPATIRLYHGAKQPTHLTFGVEAGQ